MRGELACEDGTLPGPDEGSRSPTRRRADPHRFLPAPISPLSDVERGLIPESDMFDAIARLDAALDGRYAIERGLGEGGMATVPMT